MTLSDRDQLRMLIFDRFCHIKVKVYDDEFNRNIYLSVVINASATM